MRTLLGRPALLCTFYGASLLGCNLSLPKVCEDSLEVVEHCGGATDDIADYCQAFEEIWTLHAECYEQCYEQADCAAVEEELSTATSWSTLILRQCKASCEGDRPTGYPCDSDLDCASDTSCRPLECEDGGEISLCSSPKRCFSDASECVDGGDCVATYCVFKTSVCSLDNRP